MNINLRRIRMLLTKRQNEILMMIKEKGSYKKCYEEMEQNEELKKHVEWLKYYLEKHDLKKIVENDIELFIKSAIGETFSKVLENCGVFKNNEDGEKGFRKFIQKVNEE